MDFGWPNVEIGWKMANGQLLFLALGMGNINIFVHNYCKAKISRLLI